jgi:hypothetical protein
MAKVKQITNPDDCQCGKPVKLTDRKGIKPKRVVRKNNLK